MAKILCFSLRGVNGTVVWTRFIYAGFLYFHHNYRKITGSFEILILVIYELILTEFDVTSVTLTVYDVIWAIVLENSATWRRLVMGPCIRPLLNLNSCEVCIWWAVEARPGRFGQHRLKLKGTRLCLRLITFRRLRVGSSHLILWWGISAQARCKPRSDRNSQGSIRSPTLNGWS
jgi:hypothetical protein